MRRIIDRSLKLLDRVFGGLACAALVAIMLVVLLQIGARYALPRAPAWTEELSRYLFAYAVVLAGGSLVVRQRHVRLELFQHRLSRRGSAVFTILSHLLIAAFGICLLSHAWSYARIGRFQTSPTLGVKMSWIFASALVFFSLTSLCSLLTAVQAWLRYREPGTT
jgi:TRAP-type C4-dicarboxylate transport system permease small subunit